MKAWGGRQINGTDKNVSTVGRDQGTLRCRAWSLAVLVQILVPLLTVCRMVGNSLTPGGLSFHTCKMGR